MFFRSCAPAETLANYVQTKYLIQFLAPPVVTAAGMESSPPLLSTNEVALFSIIELYNLKTVPKSLLWSFCA